jgi:hypothetical protein
MNSTTSVPKKDILNLFRFAYIYTLKYIYSLRPILLFVYTNVSTTKMGLDTSILAKSNMDRRE